MLTFLGDRIGETLTGETAPVVVNIFGEDLDVLDAKAQEVAKVLKTVPGNADVQVKAPPGAPRMAVRLRPDRLTQFGFRPVEVLEAIQTAYQGTVVAQTHRGNQVADVAVILDETDRQDPEAIGSLLLRSPQGGVLPLRELAEIYPTSGRFSILHEGRAPPPDGDLRDQRARRHLVCGGSEAAGRGQSQLPRRASMPCSAARPRRRRRRSANCCCTPPSPPWASCCC